MSICIWLLKLQRMIELASTMLRLSVQSTFSCSLFSQVDVQLNDKLVSSSSNTRAYRAYLETLMNYGKQAKKSQMTVTLWYNDTAGKMDTVGADNEGFTKRATFTATRNTVDLFGKIHADLFHHEKLLIQGIGMHLRMSSIAKLHFFS